MYKKLCTLFFLICLQSMASATDSTLIYGSWKMHYYHIYTHGGKGMDTTFFTTGHVHFYNDHSYLTEKLQMCFMEGNNYNCSPDNGGNWGFTAKDVMQITYTQSELNCAGGCPDLMHRHGIYILKLSDDNMVLRTEYFDTKRKHRLVIDAYLVRKVD